TNAKFLAGGATTQFLDETPELLQFQPRKDRATKILTYIGDVIVNGHPEIPDQETRRPADKQRMVVRSLSPGLLISLSAAVPPGTRTKLLELGPEKFAKWVRQQKQLFITDTTMRDAHQSLLATRMR